MALILIEKSDKYDNWRGINLKNIKLAGCDVKKVCLNTKLCIYIFNQSEAHFKIDAFWKTIGKEIPDDNISVFIHFGRGEKDEKALRDINGFLKTAKLNERIKVSYYSLGKDEPKGIADIYDNCKPDKEFDAKGLLDIFAIKSVAEQKVKAEQKIENNQLYITALLLLLKVNQTSLQASSKLLADLKSGLSTIKNSGIDTSILINCIEKTSLNDILSESDIKQMENDCRDILKILKTERQSLGITEQKIS